MRYYIELEFISPFFIVSMFLLCFQVLRSDSWSRKKTPLEKKLLKVDAKVRSKVRESSKHEKNKKGLIIMPQKINFPKEKVHPRFPWRRKLHQKFKLSVDNILLAVFSKLIYCSRKTSNKPIILDDDDPCSISKQPNEGYSGSENSSDDESTELILNPMILKKKIQGLMPLAVNLRVNLGLLRANQRSFGWLWWFCSPYHSASNSNQSNS